MRGSVQTVHFPLRLSACFRSVVWVNTSVQFCYGPGIIFIRADKKNGPYGPAVFSTPEGNAIERFDGISGQENKEILLIINEITK